VHTLRTPEDRFANLPDFPYAPSYAGVGDGLRMAYVEAGSPSGQPVLLLHGEPTWSFLYRKVIPPLAEAGCRVIAPDLIGFGRSDKPADVADYSYARQVEWTRAFALDQLDLRDVTLVGHDWGGLIGLRMVAEHPDRFSRVVATNTGLPTGDQGMPEVWWRFRRWIEDSRADRCRPTDSGRHPDPTSGRGGGGLRRAVPDESFKAAVRAMPCSSPPTPDDPATAANRPRVEALSTWDKPFLVAFSDNDPITAAMAPVLRSAIPGAGGSRSSRVVRWPLRAGGQRRGTRTRDRRVRRRRQDLIAGSPAHE
jgi:haloalkane dehalogenase